jgi:ribosomal protein S18 acetylase RimI-like enzyme
MQDMLVLKLANHDDAISIARMSAALIEYGLPQAWSAARVVRHIRSKESVVLVAKSGDQMMGFAVMEFGENSAHLSLFAVSTLARRRGIGQRMLEWLHETAITAGTFLISLELRAANSTAFKFYTAMGYRQSGYRPRYYSGREDAICMSRNLAVGGEAAEHFV